MDQHRQFPTWLRSVFRHLSVVDGGILDVLNALQKQGAILMTTNYDCLLDQACSLPSIGREKKDDIDRFRSGDMAGVFHIHGTYTEPQEVVLDAVGYDRITSSEEVQDLLKAFLLDKTILFVGCGTGLQDPNFGSLLSWVSNRQSDLPNRHCLLVKDNDSTTCDPLIRLRYGASYEDIVPFLNSLRYGP
jgi:hypothetical protein